jgi:NDP-sugar pyrophosphorylase family protein
LFGSANREYDPLMKAIVLVGGEGTRLRPLTLRTPKQLVPVLGRPLLLHLLEHLHDHGVDQITLAMTRTTGSAAVYAHFEGSAPSGIELSFVFEDTPLGSGGAIANAAAGWADDGEPFLVCNGDLVTDLDLTTLVAFHRERHAAVTIALHPVADPSPFGVVALEDDGRITRFVEKPAIDAAPSNLVNAGFWVFDPAIVSRLDATQFNRVEDVLFLLSPRTLRRSTA